MEKEMNSNDVALAQKVYIYEKKKQISQPKQHLPCANIIHTGQNKVTQNKKIENKNTTQKYAQAKIFRHEQNSTSQGTRIFGAWIGERV